MGGTETNHLIRPDDTLHSAAFRQRPDDAPAVIFERGDGEPQIVTRAQMAAAADRYARGLAARGIRPGDLLVIAHLQELPAVYAFWGAVRLGAVPAMFPTLTEKLDADLYMARLSKLIDLSGVRAVLTTADFADRLAPAVDCTVHATADLDTADDAVDLPDHQPQPDEIAFLQHSSGTTGLQKGVALSHAAVARQLAAYSAALDLRADDVVVSWLPLYHDMGLIAGFLLPLMCGIPLVLMSPFAWVRRPAMLLQAITDHAGTLCWLPNFAYNHSARRIRRRDVDGVSLASMRAFINCSEPVRDESHQQFLDRFAAVGMTADKLSVCYAMAENVFAVTQTAVGRPPRIDRVDEGVLAAEKRAVPPGEGAAVCELVSCGRPIAGTDVWVMDGDRPLPERRVGEIVIRSDCMLRGYYNRPDLEPFDENGRYRTGDMGYLADGELFVIGRKKEIIINAGKNVYPQDVEAAVGRVAGVKPGRAVAFGVWDEREGTELIAVVAESAVDEAQRHEVGRAIRQAVARETMVTAAFVQVVAPGWLIKTSSGKIARGANRRKWMDERDTP